MIHRPGVDIIHIAGGTVTQRSNVNGHIGLSTFSSEPVVRSEQAAHLAATVSEESVPSDLLNAVSVPLSAHRIIRGRIFYYNTLATHRVPT